MSRLNLSIFLFVACCTMSLLPLQAQQRETTAFCPEWMKKYDARETRDMFDNPPMFYAPHTFWFWDDVITDEQTAAAMAEEMARQHMNPGYAHPRSGFDERVTALPVEQYLAAPWFNSFDNALRRAKEHGLTLGYCDDYNWPSGQAAGKVLENHPELEATYLAPRRHYACGGDVVRYDSVDFAVAGKMSDHQLDAATLRVIGEGDPIEWRVPAGDWMIYTYTVKNHPGIDGGRVNYLDPKLMEVFIPLVHEQYDKHFGAEMGRSIPGVFVDNEGDYGWKMAWSEYLADRYREKKHRDIRTWLPLLTEQDKKGLFVVARCDWFEVVSDVYNECYFEPLVAWLKERNMYYISNLWEESLQLETIAVGDLMKTTRCVTMPGNDCLEMKSQDVHDFKEIQSVAEFEDRPFMSEIMGYVGWDQTPEMMKMTINSVTSFGVSHVVPHGIYMNRQIESVPFPSDWYTENPYWNYLHLWNDFARRASFVTRQSSLVANVLLINPLETVWSFSENYFSEEEGVQNAPWDPRAEETNQVYTDAMRRMNQANIDFLVADRYYLSKATLRQGSDRTEMTINGHDFHAIVLPSTYIIPQTSFRKIVEFARKGGLVILLGSLPHGSPEKGLNDPLIHTLSEALKRFPNVVDLSSAHDKMAAMIRVLNEKTAPQLRLEESAGRLYTAQRKIGDIDLYWLANNTDTLKRFTAWFRDGQGAATIWDCETGQRRVVSSTAENGYRKVSLTLNPFEAYWLAFDPTTDPGPTDTIAETAVGERIIDTSWEISYPDVHTVDKITAKVFYSDSLRDDELLDVGYDDSEWRYFSREEEDLNPRTYGYWRMNIPVGARSVIVPSSMLGKEIRIDGENILVSDSRIDLTPGSKLLAFVVNRHSSRISVEPFRFVVDTAPDQELTSWYDYGLQQYTGFLEYRTSITVDEAVSSVSLDLGGARYVVEVFVNGHSVGARLWPPFRFDITEFVSPGVNDLRIKVGNLIASRMWLKDDLGRLRIWNWNRGKPDFEQINAGLFGPVKLIFSSSDRMPACRDFPLDGY